MFYPFWGERGYKDDNHKSSIEEKRQHHGEQVEYRIRYRKKKTNNINPIKTWEVNSRALKMTAFLVPLVTAIKTIQCNNFER